jgi:hypothetical protein
MKELGANLISFLAIGKADALSGCFINVHGNLQAMIERAETIQRKRPPEAPISSLAKKDGLAGRTLTGAEINPPLQAIENKSMRNRTSSYIIEPGDSSFLQA